MDSYESEIKIWNGALFARMQRDGFETRGIRNRL